MSQRNLVREGSIVAIATVRDSMKEDERVLAREAVQLSGDHPEPAVTLRGLEVETASMALLVCGISLIGGLLRFSDPMQGSISGLLLSLVAISSWRLHRTSHLASAWTLVVELPNVCGVDGLAWMAPCRPRRNGRGPATSQAAACWNRRVIL